MIKKLILCFLSVIFSVILLEIILQILPLIYKQIPLSQEKMYVYVIGESTAYGHPYQGKINFSKIVAETLNWTIDNKKIEIINLAVPGCKPFYQYQRYFLHKCIHPFKKGIVFMYMVGTNGNTFDKDYLNKNYSEFALNSILFSCIHPYFIKTYNLEYYYTVLIKLIHKFGDEAYISTVLGNFSGVMPNNVDLLIQNENLKIELMNIDDLILDKQYDSALHMLNENLNKYEDKSHILYRIGKIYENQNKIKEANDTYRKMICDDDLRPTIKENKMIRNLVKKYNFELIDMEEALIKKEEIIGFNFFMDLIHPTIDLNIFIAKNFVKKLEKKHFINYNDIDIEKYFLSVLLDENWFIIYRDSLGEIFFFSHRKNFSDIYNKSTMLKYIDKMYEFHNKIDDKGSVAFKKREEIIHICETLFEYIQGNENNAIDLIKRYNLKDTICRREEKDENRMQCFWYMKHWLVHLLKKNNIPLK